MKIGHFRKKARDEYSNKKETETESDRISGISKKIAYPITWKIYLTHAFPGISKYLPYLNLETRSKSGYKWFLMKIRATSLPPDSLLDHLITDDLHIYHHINSTTQTTDLPHNQKSYFFTRQIKTPKRNNAPLSGRIEKKIPLFTCKRKYRNAVR